MKVKFVVAWLLIEVYSSLATPTENLSFSEPFQYIADEQMQAFTRRKPVGQQTEAKTSPLRNLSPSINWTMPYDPNFAELALEFASAAYAVDPQTCATRNDAVIEKMGKIPCDYWKDECWTFIARTPSLIIFSVRGTRTRLQLILELVETMSAPKKLFPAGGSVQHYFYTALQYIWKNGFGIELRRLRIKYPDHKILFTGHSLGGALSSIAATLFAYENADLPRFDPRKDVHLVTFGQPRVGNSEYAQAHDLLVPNSWRMIHRYDIVAHLPYCYEDYHRQCTSAHHHSPFHHGTEIWYPETMYTNQSIYRICREEPINEDSTCSNGYYVHYNINDHLYYFEKDVDFYGSNGCNQNLIIPPLPNAGPIISPASEEDSKEDEEDNKTKRWPRRHRGRKQKTAK